YRQAITRNRSGADTERYSGLTLDNAAHLPSRDNLSRCARSFEGQVVTVVHVEAVLQVVSGQAPVVVRVVRIRQTCCGIAGKVRAKYCVGHTHVLAESISGLYTQAA